MKLKKKINLKKYIKEKITSCQPGLTWLTHYIRNEIGIKKLFFLKKWQRKKRPKLNQ
jgi:hypothetical protein